MGASQDPSGWQCLITWSLPSLVSQMAPHFLFWQRFFSPSKRITKCYIVIYPNIIYMNFVEWHSLLIMKIPNDQYTVPVLFGIFFSIASPTWTNRYLPTTTCNELRSRHCTTNNARLEPRKPFILSQEIWHLAWT